jgi:F0F1-type ATP synthase assembly protein I
MIKGEIKELLHYFSLITQLGLTMVCSILIGFGAGFLLDKKLGTGGLFIGILTFCGIIGGFLSAYKQIMAKFNKDKGK